MSRVQPVDRAPRRRRGTTAGARLGFDMRVGGRVRRGGRRPGGAPCRPRPSGRRMRLNQRDGRGDRTEDSRCSLPRTAFVFRSSDARAVCAAAAESSPSLPPRSPCWAAVSSSTAASLQHQASMESGREEFVSMSGPPRAPWWWWGGGDRVSRCGVICFRLSAYGHPVAGRGKTKDKSGAVEGTLRDRTSAISLSALAALEGVGGGEGRGGTRTLAAKTNKRGKHGSGVRSKQQTVSIILF